MGCAGLVGRRLELLQVIRHRELLEQEVQLDEVFYPPGDVSAGTPGQVHDCLTALALLDDRARVEEHGLVVADATRLDDGPEPHLTGTVRAVDTGGSGEVDPGVEGHHVDVNAVNSLPFRHWNTTFSVWLGNAASFLATVDYNSINNIICK